MTIAEQIIAFYRDLDWRESDPLDNIIWALADECVSYKDGVWVLDDDSKIEVTERSVLGHITEIGVKRNV